MEEYVEAVKAPVLFMSIRNNMLGETRGKGVGFFPVLHETPEHPEQGMDPEDREDEEEQACHEDKGIKEDRIFFPVIMFAMGIVSGKERSGLAVALAACLDKIVRIYARFRVIGWKNVMSGVTIGTTRNLFRETETVVLAMVAGHVRLDRNGKYVVTLHHLFVSMALQTDFCMKFPVFMRLGITKRLDFMQVMAVVAGRGIVIACRHCLAVDGVTIDRLLVMALDTLGNNDLFIPFPVLVDVNIGVAVCAHNPFGAMDAEIVLGSLFLVTALALYPPDLHLALHMPGEIGYLHMTTGAAILAVN